MSGAQNGGLERTRLPEGARDLLPVERGELEAIERGLREAFTRFGYREVRTPMVEYADVMDRAQEGGVGRAFRLFDDLGQVLVLRPDLTIPVARLVASRYTARTAPLRLSYVAPIARPAKPGRAQGIEERQAGVELIGVPGEAADAEVIALVVGTLRGLGITDLRVGLGDVGLMRALVGGLGASQEEQVRLEAAARAKDLIAWRDVSEASDAPASRREVLAALPTRRGGAELLDELADAVPAAADRCRALAETLRIVGLHGAGDAVMIDLGVLRDWGYYSGVVFEAYAPDVGRPVAVGGRYDDLLGRFGAARPAVGFGVLLDVLHEGLRARTAAAGPLDGAVVVGGLETALDTATRLRASGVPVAAVATSAEADDLAAADGWRFVVVPDGEATAVVDRAAGERVSGTDPVEVIASRRS